MFGPVDPHLVTPYQALIRSTRLAKEMTVSELARRAGMPRSTVHKIENQPPKDKPEDTTVDKLSSALGIPRGQILDALSESLGLRVSYGRPALITQQLMDLVATLPPDQRALWFKLARSVADVLATVSTGTDSDRPEISGSSHDDPHRLPSVTTEGVQLTPDISAVLGRLGQAAQASPELRSELATFSEDLFRRYGQKRTNG